MRIALMLAAVAFTANIGSASPETSPRVPVSEVEVALDQNWPWGAIQTDNGRDDDVTEAELGDPRRLRFPRGNGDAWEENQRDDDDDEMDDRDEEREGEGWGRPEPWGELEQDEDQGEED